MVGLLLACAMAAADAPPADEVYYAPGSGPREAILRAVGGATHEVYVQAYEFTDPAIFAALKAAKDRKVRVYVLLDEGQASSRYSQAMACEAQTMDVTFDGREPIAHQKVILCDPRTDHPVMCWGSYNFTGQAARNSEKLQVCRHPGECTAQLKNWLLHREHARDRPQLLKR